MPAWSMAHSMNMRIGSGGEWCRMIDNGRWEVYICITFIISNTSI